jgi:type I restriction enzyme, S subunit
VVNFQPASTSQIKSEDLTSEGYKIYGQENVINRNFDLGHRYLDEDKFQELTVYEIFSGDLLITMMGTSGKCEIAPSNLKQGIMDSHLIRLRTNGELFVEFARYLIDQSDYVEYQIQQLGKGSIMHGLNSTVIKNLAFLLPPIEEQYSIVDFLNYKTHQIDQLIEKKKALIEKLNEQRIAVITQAVTKGLDKTAKMKPSGLDWLGDCAQALGGHEIKPRCKVKKR